MKLGKLKTAAIALLLCSGLAVHADTLTLKQCISVALKNSPQVLNARGVAMAAQGGYISARSGYFPQIRLQSKGANGSADLSETYSASITAQQTIFDFGKTPAQSGSSRKQWEAASLDSQSIIQDIVLNTTIAYYSFLQAQALEEVMKEGLKQAEVHLNQTKILMEAGRGVRYNVIKGEVDYANARLNLIKRKNIVINGRLQLENAIGAKISPNDTVLENITLVPDAISGNSAINTALHKRPEIKSSDLKVMSAQYQMAAANRSRWPALSAGGAYGYRTSKLDATGADYWSAELNLSMPLFLGGSIRGSVKQAEGGLNTALAAQSSALQTVTIDVEQQLAAQNEAFERIEISAKAVEQAELALTLAQERFSLGSGSSLEMTDAELSLENSRIARIQALCDYRIAQAQLKRAMGILEME